MSLTHHKSIRRQQGPVREVIFMQYLSPDLTEAHGDTINWDQPFQGREAPGAMESPRLCSGTHGRDVLQGGTYRWRGLDNTRHFSNQQQSSNCFQEAWNRAEWVGRELAVPQSQKPEIVPARWIHSLVSTSLQLQLCLRGAAFRTLLHFPCVLPVYRHAPGPRRGAQSFSSSKDSANLHAFATATE